MKRQTIVMILSVTAQGFGGEPPADESSAAMIAQPAPKSRWSLSSGVRARSIGGDFGLGSVAPSGFSLGNAGKAQQGKGDVGFFEGGTGTVTYDDGSVGPAYGTQPGDGAADGSAYATINSPGQLTSTGRYDSNGDEIFDLSFHSSSSVVRGGSGYSPGGFGSSDDEVVASPYIELRYSLAERRNWGFNLVAGYSYARAGLGSGAGILGTAFNRKTTTVTNYTYTYDHYAFNSGAIGGDYPFNDTEAATIYDADAANAPGGYTQNTSDSLAPRGTVDRTQTAVDQEYTAIGSADLDVNLHELLLAAEVTYQVGDKLQLTAAVGPTLNFLDSSLDVSSDWYLGGKSVSSASSSSSDVAVRAGVMSQVAVRYFPAPNWFIEANGGYRFVPEVSTNSGIADADIDASSWVAGFGVGFRF